MKKLVALLIGSVLLVSCQKEKINSPPKISNDWKVDIQNLVSSQLNFSNPKSIQVLDKKTAAIVGADMCGAWEGATSGMVWGPWGAVAGGILCGAGASIGTWGLIPRIANPNPDTVISNNPYWFVGRAHNKICRESIQNPNIFTEGQLNQVYQGIATDITEKSILDQQGEVKDWSNTISLDSYIEKINKISQIASQDKYYVPESTSENLNYIFKKCLEGLDQCDTQEKAIIYLNKFEQIIIDAPLSESDKRIALIGLSVGQYSTKLWY
jgi:hypothetical protein